MDDDKDGAGGVGAVSCSFRAERSGSKCGQARPGQAWQLQMRLARLAL